MRIQRVQRLWPIGCSLWLMAHGISWATAANAAGRGPWGAGSPQIGYSLIRVTPSLRNTETGERILQVDLILNGQVIEQLPAVSGKATAQQFRLGRDSRAGSREPLPQGTYRIEAVDRQPGLPAEIGHTFIPLTPQFSTGRRYLGIHQDADRAAQGGAGTLGCLGLLSQQGIDSITKFILLYQVKTLVVDYGLR